MIPYFDRAGESETTRKKRKTIYTCPVCEGKLVGKAGKKPHCGDHEECGLALMIVSNDTNRIATAAWIEDGVCT